ncbi:MAG: phosphate ABC transporter substrate-binding protein [Bacillota bacterium]
MNLNRRNVLTIMAAALVGTTLLAAGCSNGSAANGNGQFSGKISVAGSTALGPLVKQAADEFGAKYPKVSVDVSGGGSFVGLNQVAAGSVDIGASDVAFTDEYKDKGLVDHVVAIAPFAIIINSGVTVDNLTKAQLVDIFTGKVTNWKDVGGQNQAIAIIGRSPASGSRATIKATILGDKDFDPKGAVLNSSGDVRKAVATTPGAIGYVDLAFVDSSIKAIKVDGVACTADNVISRQYKIYANEHLYTKGEPKDAVKAFLDMVMSADFQDRNVAKLGFIPVSKMPK